MEVVKFHEETIKAVAKDCFDLPLVQCLDLCEKCDGKGKIMGILQADPNDPRQEVKGLIRECPHCADGVIRVRLVSNWKFTEEEFQYMVDHPEARGIFLSICAPHTPPVNITVGNPLEIWADSVVTLKQFQKNKQDNG